MREIADILMSLLPQNDVVFPAALAFGTYGVRFIAFAALAFFTVDPSRNPDVGYNSMERPAGFDLALNIRRELRQSLVTLCVLTTVFTAFFGYGWLASSQLYHSIDDYPRWWFLASIPVMIFLHDTFFYWLHRTLHTRLLFERFHRPHHASVFTTAFTAYSFGWQEALAEALIVLAIIFIMPIHPAAFVIFQTLSIAYNVYGHCGRELLPQGLRNHWLGRAMNSPTLHSHHHRFSNGNYSFYFTFWDRVMGTLVQSRK